MPTLDGIVVTEPKETEVYTFNKNDIKKIAKESIEQADKLELNPNGTFRAFENIVDKDGHPRFIEGDIELVNNAIPTKIYGKWALSGTHLLLVLCLSAKQNDNISGGIITKPINIPQWILDKITPLWGGVEVDKITIYYYDVSSNQQSTTAYLEKKDTGLVIYHSGLGLTQDRACRIAFDLLIDNE